MSENPYARYPSEKGPSLEEMDDGPSRLSVLALGALLLSIPSCCIPLLGIGTGPVAAILGIAALFVIGRSKGRLGGRGLAATAIFLGVISTALWGAVGAGINSGYQWYLKNPVATTNSFIVALQKDDLAAARGFLSTGAANDVSDEQLREYSAAMKSAYGEYTRAPGDLSLWFKAFRDAYTGGNAPQGQQRGSSQDPPLPVALEFASNRLTVGYSVAEPARLQAGAFAIDDMVIILPDKRGLILRKDGPAKFQATVFSAGPVSAGEWLAEKSAPPGEKAPAEQPPAPESPTPPSGATPPEKPGT